ncbi:MAG TPA: arginase family protein [Solirubrobacteraceae bacterium]|jgi:formiminoglutamase/agmatinase
MPGAFHQPGAGTPSVLLAARGRPRERYGLLGVPYDAATTIGNPGARYAPGVLREMLGDWIGRRVRDSALADLDLGLIDLSSTEIMDFGDVELSYADTLATVGEISAAVARVIEAEAIPMTIGGDHGVTFPAFRALHDHTDGPIGLIQLDAHCDLDPGNPRQGAHSGSSGIRRALELERLDGANVVQIGLRGYTPVEQYELGQQLGLRRITARELEEVGAEAAAQRALAWLGPELAAVYLTVDLDVLDPGSAPGTGWPEPAGIRTADLLRLIRAFATRVSAIDIAELNPLFDSRSSATAVLAARVLLDFIATRARSA